uniref:Uncharacterized protein n=1 Tax=Nymphaea colorata TaxID=210225 RepID=A0A5K1ARA3_9MAGN
MNMINDGR